MGVAVDDVALTTSTTPAANRPECPVGSSHRYSLLDALVSVRIRPDIQWEYCYHTMIRHRVEAIPRSALDCNQS
ncbi:hypothetical protein GFS60_01230 [Rhodococcus sp. WAY2]|jgi:hypothetical protein|nr:hypothetical protein GFS60_01230 [Rhodococcus sp. WAY2]